LPFSLVKRSTKHAGGPRPPETKVKFTTLHADKKSEVKVNNKVSPVIKDWTIVVVADPSGNLTQMTVCRPIGTVPNTTAISYVMIPSDHVESYIQNIQNPLELEANQALAKARDEFFLKQGFYTKPESGVLTWNGKTVHEIWKEARSRSELKLKADKAVHKTQEEQHGRFQPGDPRNPGNAKDKLARPFTGKARPVEQCLPDDLYARRYAEEKEKWEKSPDYSDAKLRHQQAINSYTTMGGPDGSTPQRVITWLEGVPPNLVKQFLVRSMYDPEGTAQDIAVKYRRNAPDGPP
jgi:hypothetical protein